MTTRSRFFVQLLLFASVLAPVARGEDMAAEDVFAVGTSAGVCIDTRTDETHWIAPGTVEELYGKALWTAPAQGGAYALTHNGDGATWRANFKVVGEGIEVVGDLDLVSDATWGAGKTWIVAGTVRVGEGATLTIESGATVLQSPGGSILSGGGTVSMEGVTVASLDAAAVRSVETGSGVRIDTRTDETHWIAPGTVEELYGEAPWVAPAKAGAYALTHEGDGGTWRANYEVIGADVEVVGDVDLAGNATWGADKTWIVAGTVRVGEGATLTIESGTTVWQGPEGSILSGGGTVAMEGVTLASLDAAGVRSVATGAGVRIDTRTDETHWIAPGTVEELYGEAAWTAPVKAGAYALTHEGDGGTWRANYEVIGEDVEVVGDVDFASDATWGAGKTWLVMGTVRVGAGATLTIENGATVLQSPGGSILAGGGTVSMEGVAVASLDAAAVRSVATGDGVRIDTRTDETHWIAPGTVEELYGEAPWTAPAKAGTYALTHIGDGATWTAKYEVEGKTFAVVGDLDVEADTMWGVDKTWLVTGTVVVKPGTTLTVESGANVVFDVAGSLLNGGGTILAEGAVFANRVVDGFLKYGEASTDGVFLDTTAGEVQVSEGIERITYGTEWGETPADSVEVQCTGPNGEEKTLVSAMGPAEGAVEWKTQEAGGYDLRHVAGEETMTARFVVPDWETTVVVKGGSIVGNVEWGKEKTILVVGPVVVEKGATLTIARGAVVKFMAGAGLDCASGGSCVAEGVVFTHVNDDTAGGDTLFDGESEPVVGQYTIGNIQIDDSTQLRYYPTTVETLAGTISANETWRGWNVYHVTGDLAIANGATLTINPGAIVKFDAGVSLTVNSGGALNAIGTRAQPIVFTSVKDDEHGGDTNGDGDVTTAQPGDWTTIKVAGGAAHFSHTFILYSSRNQTTGAINMTGGKVVFDSGEIAHGLYDAVGVESGNFHMTNSVIRDCLLAFRHWARDPIVNCVIYDCGRLTQGGGQHFRNCIFANITEAWEAFGFPQNGTTYDNCCFWNDGGNVLTGEGTQDAMAVCGKNGNIWGNPLFLDEDGGDFRVVEGSPCVDAGDSTVAPETDFFGQPRVSVFGDALADIGIYEVQPRGVAGDVDLTVASVATDAEAVPGGELRVAWVVENRGKNMASGARRDAVSLVSASGREVSLGEKVYTQNVAAGGTAKCEAVFRVPVMAEGTWYPKVVANSQQDIFEGSLIANNARTGDAGVDVSVPETATSAGASGMVAAGVPTVLKLHFGANDGNRMVVLNVSQGMSVSWGFGFVPQGVLQAGGTTAADGLPVQFLVPDAEDEMDVYVVLESDTTANYELSTESTKLTVMGVTPETLPSSGMTTLTITGAGFGETNAVTLVGAGVHIRLQTVERDLSGNLVAVADCSLLAGGQTYGLTVESDGRAVELPDAVYVKKEEGKGILQAKLAIADSARAGRDAIGFIEYANVGNADMDAPIFKVEGGQGRTLVATAGTGGPFTNVIRVVGIGGGHPAGTLKAGEKRRMPFRYKVNSGYTVRLTVIDSASEEPRASLYPTWEVFSRGIAEAATAVNSAGLEEVSDYEEIYAQAMRTAYGLPSGVVTGILRDSATGAGLAGIELLVTDEDGNVEAGAVTDTSGIWRVTGLKTGKPLVVLSCNCQMGDYNFTVPESGWARLDLEGLPLATVVCGIAGVTAEEADALSLVAVPAVGPEIRGVFRDGVFSFAGLSDGTYTLRGEGTGTGFMVATNECTVVVKNGGVAGALPIIGFVQGGILEVSFERSDEAEAFPVPFSIQGTNGFGADLVSGTEGTTLVVLPEGVYSLDIGPGFVADGLPEITMKAGKTFRTSVAVSEMPFAAFPSCGPAALQCEFVLLHTNAWGDGFKCAWDFDGDGVTDSTDPAPTNIFAESGLHAVALTITRVDGTVRRYENANAVDVWEEVKSEAWNGTLVVADEDGLEIIVADGDGFVVRGSGGELPGGFWEGRVVVLPGEELSPRRILELSVTGTDTIACRTEQAYVTEAFKTLRATSHFMSRSSSGAIGYKTYRPVNFKDEIEFPGVDLGDRLKFTPKFEVPLVVSVDVADGEVVKIVASATVKGMLDVTLHTAKCKVPEKEPDDRTLISWSTPKLPPVGAVPSHFSISYVAQAELKGEGTFHYEWGKKWECVWKDDGKGLRKNVVPLEHDCSVSGNVEFDAKVGLELGIGLGARKSSTVYADVANLSLEVGVSTKVGLEMNFFDESKPDKYDFHVGVYAMGKFNLLEARYKELHATAFSAPFDFTEYLPKDWRIDYSWTTPIPAYATTATKAGDNAWAVTLESRTGVPAGTEFKSRKWMIGGEVFNDGGSTVSKTLQVAADDTVEYETKLFEGYQPDVGLLRWIGLSWFNHQKASASKIVLSGNGRKGEPEIVYEKFTGKVPKSCDPNEMAGPMGAGAARHVAPGTWLTYTVYFENKSDATAAAQEVSVSMALDGALDWGTFEVVDVGFNNQIDLGLGGKRRGTSETAMTGTAYKVRTELDFDEKTGVAKWYMRIVDERTETRWPKDVFAGFLPPNDETGRGEGHITYRVKVRDDAAAGTVVRASASIVFDYNEAIETDPAWWNTVAEMGEATVDLGNGVATNVEVMVGAPWGGQLPDPGKMEGLRFAGWFTGPDGTGEEVTEESLVENGAKLYAFWDASAAPELWLDVSWGAVEIGMNGVVKGYAPDGSNAEGSANRYVLTGTSTVYGVKFAGGSFTNTWTNLCVKLGAKDAVAVALESANVEVELAGDNMVSSGENGAGIRVDEESALVLQGTGRLAVQGGAYGARIGGGREQKNGRIEIRGGTVDAKGGDFGMGIGGGMAESGTEVVITGGSVKARGDREEDIGSGDGEASVEAPKDGMGAPVYEVEVPFATDALPVTVAVDLGGGRTYQYEGRGHEGDSSLWFWLPDGTYEFEADGDDYGAHVEGARVAAVFTDPGSAHFVAPAAETLEATGEGWRVGLNPAYRTTPFELWTATGLMGSDWDWVQMEKGMYRVDAETGTVEWEGKTEGLRVFKFEFLPKE